MSDSPKTPRSLPVRIGAYALDRISSWVANNSATPAGQAARQALERAYLRAANLDILDPGINGEYALLQRLAPRFPARMIFDVGANVGEWSVAAAVAFPAATIHSFEPSRGASAALEQRLAREGLGSPRVRTVRLALAESAGTRTLYEYGESDLSSLAEWHGNPLGTAAVQVDTGAAYAAKAGIEAVDFVKIDVEGFEMDVLQGLAPLVRDQRIGLVQFEYGIFSLERNFRLRNFFDFFGSGYRIGRVMPAGVEFADYHWHIEGGHFGNYLAARNDLAAMAS